MPPWTTTTAEIAERVGVTGKTVREWAKRGLLPTPRTSYRGRRGRVALWPNTAIAQAVWVHGQLEAGVPIPEILEILNRPEIKAALEAGEFKPPAS